jgi:hypothetical protein
MTNNMVDTNGVPCELAFGHFVRDNKNPVIILALIQNFIFYRIGCVF